MFIESTNKLESEASDETFCLRIFERYNKIQERNLKYKDQPSSYLTSHTPSSGATTTTLPYEQIQRMDKQQIPSSKGDTGVSGLPETKEEKSPN